MYIRSDVFYVLCNFLSRGLEIKIVIYVLIIVVIIIIKLEFESLGLFLVG